MTWIKTNITCLKAALKAASEKVELNEFAQEFLQEGEY
jgi:hypothetical protein